ncbi:MAG: tRNA epoxyqueuosine(34) reductase QueG [Ignavibacteria bacterium]|nr:tRNA epoxyqueuosine(34) reductase QueG [Ignavibacteria bacterium]
MSILNNQTVIDAARKVGFDLIGFSEFCMLAGEIENLKKWLQKDYHAGMKYMENNLDKKADISLILPEVRSVISLGINYYKDDKFSGLKNKGKVSRYAWGKDYHFVIWEKIDELIQNLKKIDAEFKAVSYVDTGPVMDKMWAVKSGLGWQGKNTNIISKEIGSWFFIANILCNRTFDYSIPETDFCGKCTACMDACPTGAITEPYIIDSNRCISYLTIENKNDISEKFKNKFDNWIFGCDICQDVCPWNIKFAVETKSPDFSKIQNKEIDLNQIMTMTNSEFKEKFFESPIMRAKLKGLKRNGEFLSK